MPRHPPGERLAILERRKHVARRYLRGELQHEIAQAFEVDQATISRDLRVIHDEWLAQTSIDRAAWIAQEVGRIDEIEREAWLAWKRSQEDAVARRARLRAGVGESEETRKGQAGDARFLQVVLNCVERRCKILGVEKPPGPSPESKAPAWVQDAMRQAFGDRPADVGLAELGQVTVELRAALERRGAGLGSAPDADLGTPGHRPTS